MEDLIHGAGYPNWSNPDIADYGVQYGKDWTYVVWDFNVPAQYQSDGGGTTEGTAHQYPPGVWATVTELVPWLGPGWGTYTCYFSDFQFYVNPAIITKRRLTISKVLI
jgi:hypothetical protein